MYCLQIGSILQRYGKKIGWSTLPPPPPIRQKIERNSVFLVCPLWMKLSFEAAILF
jgi:hypothetical protein